MSRSERRRSNKRGAAAADDADADEDDAGSAMAAVLNRAASIESSPYSLLLSPSSRKQNRMSMPNSASGGVPLLDRAATLDSHERRQQRSKRQTLGAEIRLNFEAPPAAISPRFQQQRLHFIQNKLQQLSVDRPGSGSASGFRSAPTSPRRGRSPSAGGSRTRSGSGSGSRGSAGRRRRHGAAGDADSSTNSGNSGNNDGERKQQLTSPRSPRTGRRERSASPRHRSGAGGGARSHALTVRGGSGGRHRRSASHDADTARLGSAGRGGAARRAGALLTASEHAFLDEQAEQNTAGFRSLHDDVVLLARNVYSAACEDLGMSTSLEREARFVSSIIDLCRRGHFHLQNRRLGAKAACEIAKFLLHHEMKCINAFRDHPEAIALTEAEQYRRFGLVPFTSVDLTGNALGNDGAGMLAELLRCSRSITSVAVGTNDFTAKG